jgi:4-amino-4-deoxy-L-arabinose transferase-like glycosyltransferase
LKLLLALALTTPFWDLGHPLWEVDDARYAEVPREMVARGSWLTPTLNDCDYVEKPPLIYWLPAASYRLFGVSEAAARLPNALLALLGLLGIWWLGAWLFTPATGMWAAVVLATTSEYFMLGRLLTPDMTVSVFLLWAAGLALRCLHRPEDARWASPLAWLAMALAFLSKGLIALLFPGLWTAALLVLFPELRRGLKGLLLSWGPAVFLVIVGGWFAAMELRHPGFFHFFVIEQHFQRFLTPRYARPGPWYYFIGVDAAGTLPWTPLLLAASLLPLLRWRSQTPERRQLALWVALVFAFFSVSKSKLPTYILPLFAFQALLGAERIARGEPDFGTRWYRRPALALSALILAAACAAPFLAPRFLKTPLPPIVVPLAAAAAALLAIGLGASALTRRGGEGESPRPLGALLTPVLACAAFALMLAGARPLAPQLSARDLAAELSMRLRPGDRLFVYDKYLHGLPFYLGRRVDVVVNWLGELHYAKRDPRFADRFGDDNTIRAVKKGERVFVVLPKKTLQAFRALRPPNDPPTFTTVGDYLIAEL